MSDDSLDGMPDFAKPEEEKLPLVVPDTGHILSPGFRCKSNNKAGNPCGFPKRRDSEYCTAHDPRFSAEQRKEWREKGRRNNGGKKREFGPKKKNDLLLILSNRLDMFTDRFGEMTTPEIETTICTMLKTYCYILVAEGASEDEVSGKWRIGRAM